MHFRGRLTFYTSKSSLRCCVVHSSSVDRKDNRLLKQQQNSYKNRIYIFLSRKFLEIRNNLFFILSHTERNWTQTSQWMFFIQKLDKCPFNNINADFCKFFIFKSFSFLYNPDGVYF